MIKVCDIRETDIDISQAHQLVLEAFKKWQDNGINSNVCRMSLSDYIYRTKEYVILVALTETNELVGTWTIDIEKASQKRRCAVGGGGIFTGNI